MDSYPVNAAELRSALEDLAFRWQRDDGDDGECESDSCASDCTSEWSYSSADHADDHDLLDLDEFMARCQWDSALALHDDKSTDEKSRTIDDCTASTHGASSGCSSRHSSSSCSVAIRSDGSSSLSRSSRRASGCSSVSEWQDDSSNLSLSWEQLERQCVALDADGVRISAMDLTTLLQQ